VLRLPFRGIVVSFRVTIAVITCVMASRHAGGGVGAALGKFFKAGDKMEAGVEKIGVLAKKVVAP
jgi:hypothetical protein